MASTVSWFLVYSMNGRCNYSIFSICVKGLKENNAFGSVPTTISPIKETTLLGGALSEGTSFLIYFSVSSRNKILYRNRFTVGKRKGTVFKRNGKCFTKTEAVAQTG